MIRCGSCETLNEDSSVFCKECSSRLRKKRFPAWIFLCVALAVAVAAGISIPLLVTREKSSVEYGLEEGSRVLEELGSKNKIDFGESRGREIDFGKLPEQIHDERETVDLHGIEVKVWDSEFLLGDALNRPDTGNKYLVVDLEVRNQGTHAVEISSILQMSVMSKRGEIYRTALYFPAPRFPDGKIFAKKKARGKVSFEVPSGENDLFFIFRPDLKSRGEIGIRLDL
ncbi:MAG: DUF4352 domain-containing protein [Actinomycetota bacterium]|nr:DUF4352 domain-containing protein [Actinomycetota bacterium]